MSALGQKADIDLGRRDVRYGPIGDVADPPFSFNDLVVSINT